MADKNKIPSVVPSASSVHLSESKPPSSPMACLICYSLDRVLESVQFFGFILDPATEAAHIASDGEGLMPLNPRFRLDGLGLAAFCIVNSILYVFEGRDCSYDDRKSIYSFDLSSLLNESSSEMVVIEKGMLDKCAEMECDKCAANAILTPNGKILIHSVLTGAGCLDIDFELFDPDTNQCRPLPQLPKTLSEKFRIHGYGFLSDTVFLVSTDHGKYSFDFDSNSGWESLRSSFEPWGLFVGLGNELFTGDGLIRKGDKVERLDPRITRFPDSVQLKLMQWDHRSSWICRRSSSICLLDVAEKEYTLCIARVLFVSGEGNEQPCVIFDAYKSDLAQLAQKTKASFNACIPGELVAFDSSTEKIAKMVS